MSIAVSKDSLSNRRLYLKNRRTLISFSEEGQLDRITLGSSLCEKYIEALKPDLVSVGDHALRLKAADTDGRHPREMSFTYTAPTPFCLSDAPMLTFAISPYDGERDSQYFSDVAENKYFVEKPDPLLVSRSYVTVTLMGGGYEASRTVQLTNYGFNRIYANFAGEPVVGMSPDFEIGDLMIITDHINFFPEHPLHGKNIPYGPRFPDMSEAYDKLLIEKADEIAREKGIKVQHGVYIGTQGPTFETPAEYKMFHILGADAVGMSTVPEVIVANHCGIKVFGVSVITDLGVEGKIVEVSHEEVQKAADEAQPRMTTIMRELINRV